MNAERVLITGGAGFIGSRIAQKVVDRGGVVMIYDNFLPQVHGDEQEVDRLKARLLNDFQVVDGDIFDQSLIQKTVKEFKPTLCFHMAADTGTGQSRFESVRYVNSNVSGTSYLISALNDLDEFSRLILPSSRAVYGEGAYRNGDQYHYSASRYANDMEKNKFEVYSDLGDILESVATPEWFPPNPVSLYASTKLMQEYIVHQADRKNGWGVSTLRFQNVYGAGQSLKNPYTGVLSIFCSQILLGKTLNIFEDGLISRDFVHVDDVVDACILSASDEVTDSSPINIGSGERVFIKDIAQTLLGLLGADKENYFISGDFRDGDIRHALADVNKAKSNLNWESKILLEDGLKGLVDWVSKSV